jgi:hypothetical protein
MKTRDLCLMATGAIIAVAVIVAALTVFNPTRAQAQGAAAAPAAGGVSMIVSAGNGTGVSTIQGGTIVLQDSVNRKVTVAAYTYQITTPPTAPTLVLSTNASFTY